MRPYNPPPVRPLQYRQSEGSHETRRRDGEDDDRRRNSRQSIGDSIGQLKRFAAEGKPVFVVEYPSRKDAESVRDEIKAQGFTGLIAGRELDRLP